MLTVTNLIILLQQVGLFTLVAERFPMIANVFEIFVSICVAVVARALHQWICFSAVSLSAVSSSSHLRYGLYVD